eukprot:Clim_evm23s198 gene=Clim_evmTU23s198
MASEVRFDERHSLDTDGSRKVSGDYNPTGILRRSSASVTSTDGGDARRPQKDGYVFDPQDFTAETFNVDKLLRAARRRGTLERVHEDLTAYAASVKTDLVVMINEDYADFLNLSSSLKGLDSAIAQTREPLQSVTNEVDRDLSLTRMHLSEMKELLESQAAINRKRIALRRIISADKDLQNMEQILEQYRRSVMPASSAKSPARQSVKRESSGGLAGGAASSATTTGLGLGEVALADALSVVGAGNANGGVAAMEDLMVATKAAIAEPGPATRTQAATSTKLVQLCQEYSRLRETVELLRKSGDGEAFLQKATPRIDKIHSAITTDLTENLLRTLESIDNRSSETADDGKLIQELVSLIGLFEGMGGDSRTGDGISKLIDLFVEHYLAPLAKKTMRDALGSSSSSSGSASKVDLQGLLIKFMETAAQDRSLRLLTAAFDQRLGTGSGERLVLARAYFPSVLAALCREIPPLFTPALPAVFHRHYRQAMKFVHRDVKRQLQSDEALAAFLQTKELRQFVEKWNTTAYFQLRNREVQGMLKPSLEHTKRPDLVEVNATSLIPVAMGQTRRLVEAVNFALSEEVLLMPIVDRLTKTSFTLVDAYLAWLMAQIGDDQFRSTATATIRATDQKSGLGEAADQAPDSGAGTGGATVSEEEVNRNQWLLCMALLLDIEWLHTNLATIMAQHLQKVIVDSDAGSVNVSTTTLSDGLSKAMADTLNASMLDLSRACFNEAVVGGVPEACVKALGYVSGLPKLFRVKRSGLSPVGSVSSALSGQGAGGSQPLPPPTSDSRAVTEPLVWLMSQSLASHLVMGRTVLDAAVPRIASTLADEVTAVVEKERKREASLKKLKKGTRSATVGGSNPASGTSSPGGLGVGAGTAEDVSSPWKLQLRADINAIRGALEALVTDGGPLPDDKGGFDRAQQALLSHADPKEPSSEI